MTKFCKRADGLIFPYSPERAAKPNFSVVEIDVSAKPPAAAPLSAAETQTDPAGQVADEAAKAAAEAEAAKKPSGKK